MKTPLSTVLISSCLSLTTIAFADTVQTEWAMKDSHEIYFKGSFAQCKEQEILAGRPSVSNELESLQKYYFDLVKNDEQKIVSMYSEDDGSKKRVKEELLENDSKFTPFKDLVSVKAACFNVWGQYRLFDILWDNEYKWVDVEYCDGSACKISDFFLTIDDHSQLHSNITSHYFLNKPVLENLKKSNNFEVKFYPPTGSREHELVVAMNVSSKFDEDEVDEVKSFLTSLTSLVKYKNSNEAISPQAMDVFNLKGTPSIEDIDILLSKFVPLNGRYQSYDLAESQYALNPHISFLYNFLTNEFAPLASIQLTSSKKLLLLASKTSVIFVEQSESADGKPDYNFSFLDMAFEPLIGNSLFVAEFLKKLNLEK